VGAVAGNACETHPYRVTKTKEQNTKSVAEILTPRITWSKRAQYTPTKFSRQQFFSIDPINFSINVSLTFDLYFFNIARWSTPLSLPPILFITLRVCGISPLQMFDKLQFVAHDKLKLVEHPRAGSTCQNRLR